MKQQKNNVDEIDKLLYKYFDENKDVPRETTEVIKNTIHKKSLKKFIGIKAIATVCTLFLLTTGVVFANDIKDFISELFNLNSINIKNNSIVSSIKNKDYIQNVEMDYITLNDDYKIKIDYLLIDDLNIYLIFNLYSSNDITSNYSFSILDLSITDNNGKQIYNANMQIKDNNFLTLPGWKDIYTTNNEMKKLFFLIKNNIPNSDSLNIKFTKLVLYDIKNPSSNYIEINCNFDYNINLIDKFKNKESIRYYTTTPINNNYEIQNCIATDTGLYLIYKTNNENIDFKLYNIDTTYNINYLGRTKNDFFYFITQFHISKDDLKELNNFEIIDSYNKKLMFKKIE